MEAFRSGLEARQLASRRQRGAGTGGSGEKRQLGPRLCSAGPRVHVHHHHAGRLAATKGDVGLRPAEPPLGKLARIGGSPLWPAFYQRLFGVGAEGKQPPVVTQSIGRCPFAKSCRCCYSGSHKLSPAPSGRQPRRAKGRASLAAFCFSSSLPTSNQVLRNGPSWRSWLGVGAPVPTEHHRGRLLAQTCSRTHGGPARCWYRPGHGASRLQSWPARCARRELTPCRPMLGAPESSE